MLAGEYWERKEFDWTWRLLAVRIVKKEPRSKGACSDLSPIPVCEQKNIPLPFWLKVRV